MDCKFSVRDREKAMRYASSPLFKSALTCGEDLVISFLRKRKMRMRQSWAVGFSVLELSKFILQQHYHKVIRPAFEGRGGCSVAMSDTDSLLLVTKTSGSDEAVARIASIMDFSNYPEDHELFDSSRKQQYGFLKNEVPSARIEKFVGLRAKSYCFVTDDQRTEMKAKGVPAAFRRKIPFESMARCLESTSGQLNVEYWAIRSKTHVNRTVRGEKLAFSAFDDKRWLLCPRHSVPYGSALIQWSSVRGQCYFCHYGSSIPLC